MVPCCRCTFIVIISATNGSPSITSEEKSALILGIRFDGIPVSSAQSMSGDILLRSFVYYRTFSGTLRGSLALVGLIQSRSFFLCRARQFSRASAPITKHVLMALVRSRWLVIRRIFDWRWRLFMAFHDDHLTPSATPSFQKGRFTDRVKTSSLVYPDAVSEHQVVLQSGLDPSLNISALRCSLGKDLSSTSVWSVRC